MFSGTKKDQIDDFTDVKMWAIELMLQTLLNTKTSQPDSEFSFERKDIVKVIEFSKMLQGYVAFDVLPEEIDDLD